MDSLILYILILIIPAIATININLVYSKYKNKKNSNGLSGFEVARKILDENGLQNMYIVEVHGNLTDHYDPNQKVVRLSSEIFHGETIAAAAVAAHECGHAIQDKEDYSFMRIRSFLCPIVNFATYMAYIIFFISIFFQAFDLIMVSITLVLLSLIFQVVTLPVEFDASKRALVEIGKLDLINKSETEETEKVLKAAALTYVAAVLSSVLNLLRLIMEYNRRN